ncbi:MAG: VOC family protein [Candidatus Hodarchaeota archaeon]
MKSNPTQVKDIAIIGIYVSDLQEAKNFYVNALGLKEKGEMGPGCMLELGNVSFYLEPGRKKRLENQQLEDADITICFSVESVKKAYEEFKKRQIQITMKYTEYSPDYAVFMISDPDGNIIEIAGGP